MMMMRRYEHGGNPYAHPGSLDFSANLNPLGLSPAARATLVAQVDAMGAYPDPDARELAHALAAFEHVDEGCVVPTAGATDAFARVLEVLRPSNALVCDPCYSGYEQAAERTGARVVHHPLKPEEGFALTEEVTDRLADVDVAFIANPNNPTGRLVERDVLAHILDVARGTRTTIVLDECFIDLTTHPGSCDLLSANPHLVLVKALTKTFSLAGLRVGHALCSDPRTCAGLRAAGLTWSVSVPAQLAGVSCLADDDYLRRSRELIARERARLLDVLRTAGFTALEGAANFILFEAYPGLDESLLEHGIIVRPCDNFLGLTNAWYRIAVRLPQENARLIKALWEVMR